jgi:DDE superfamily endonuclease
VSIVLLAVHRYSGSANLALILKVRLSICTPVLLHADVRAPRPMRPRRVARRDSEYQRRGTANVYCGVQPKTERHFTKPTPNRSSPEFADYLVEIAASYPEADTIHLVMDNLSSHNRKVLVDRGTFLRFSTEAPHSLMKACIFLRKTRPHDK